MVSFDEILGIAANIAKPVGDACDIANLCQNSKAFNEYMNMYSVLCDIAKNKVGQQTFDGKRKEIDFKEHSENFSKYMKEEQGIEVNLAVTWSFTH